MAFNLTALLVFVTGAVLSFPLSASLLPALLREVSYQDLRSTLGLFFIGLVCTYLAITAGLRGECDECDGTGYTRKPEPGPAPATETITTDQPCQKCGYNLRTLDVGGTCPECGAAILAASAAERYARSRAACRQFLVGNAVLFIAVVTGLLIGGLQGVPFAFALFFSLLGLWSGVAIVANREFKRTKEKSLAFVGVPALVIGWAIITVSLAAVASVFIAGYYWFF